MRKSIGVRTAAQVSIAPIKTFDKAGHGWYPPWMKNKRLLYSKQAVAE
jgi:hypothetical protein